MVKSAKQYKQDKVLNQKETVNNMELKMEANLIITNKAKYEVKNHMNWEWDDGIPYSW